MTRSIVVTALGVFAAISCLSGAAPDGDPRSGSDVVLVEVNGVKVTLADLEKKHAGELFQAQTKYYEAERQAIEELIDESLLEQQAAKEGVTVAQLLERHVNATLAKDPSDEALRVFYEGVDTKDSFEAVRDKILESLRQRRMAKAKAAYMQSLRTQVAIVLRLPPPRAPISMKDIPVRGAANAPVTLLEYADYQCPYCQQADPIIASIEAEFKGKIAFVFKDFPLNMHPDAPKAAEATHCADAQGKYWEYHDLLYKDKQLEVDDLKAEARKLNLDGAAFDKCLDSGQQAQVVKDSLAEGTGFQLEGTPAFFINGRFLNGIQTFSQWQKVIDEELATAATRRAADNASVASR